MKNKFKRFITWASVVGLVVMLCIGGEFFNAKDTMMNGIGLAIYALLLAGCYKEIIKPFFKSI